MKPDAYFICTTPRTGSTFLCSLLKSTQIAGNPESYFRSQDKNKWADQWGVLDHIQNNFDFEEYLNACLNAGRTQNNLFACRLMWGTMDELISDIYSFSKNSLRSHKRTLDQVLVILNLFISSVMIILLRLCPDCALNKQIFGM